MVLFWQWKAWDCSDNSLCINIEEMNVTMASCASCKQNMLCLKNRTKDLGILSESRRSTPWVCLHNPKPHKWWELWGLVEKFPLAAGAEIIGPRFRRGFWYSHLEPSFDLHNSHQTAPVQVGSSDNVTYFDRFSACEQSWPISCQMMFFFFLRDPANVDYGMLYGKHMVSCDN